MSNFLGLVALVVVVALFAAISSPSPSSTKAAPKSRRLSFRGYRYRRPPRPWLRNPYWSPRNKRGPYYSSWEKRTHGF
jgi:hypothetical protein